MYASAQTDRTTQKDTASPVVLQKITVKNFPAFPNHLFITSKLPYNNRLYKLPDYQKMYNPFYQKNKWQTVFEITGHTLLTIVADKNNYRYNYTPSKQ
jgi:hypothetical protein